MTACFSAALALSDLYINPYLWVEHTPNNAVLAFAAEQSLSMALVFGIARRVGVRAGRWMALGALTLIAFMTGIMVGGGQIRHWIALLGALSGVGFGLYWQGFFVAVAHNVPSPLRDRFNARLGTWEALSSVIAPLGSAWLITQSGRHYLFVFALSILGLLPVLLLGANWNESRIFPSPTTPRHNPSLWRSLLAAHGVRGLYEGIWMALPGLLLFELTRSPWQLAGFTSLTAGLSILSFEWTGNHINPTQRGSFMWLGAGLMAAAAVWLWSIPGVCAVWGFGFFMALAHPLQQVPLEAFTLDMIGQDPRSADRQTASKELSLNLGRGLGLVFVALAGFWLTGIAQLRQPLLPIPILAASSAVLFARFPHRAGLKL